MWRVRLIHILSPRPLDPSNIVWLIIYNVNFFFQFLNNNTDRIDVRWEERRWRTLGKKTTDGVRSRSKGESVTGTEAVRDKSEQRKSKTSIKAKKVDVTSR